MLFRHQKEIQSSHCFHFQGQYAFIHEALLEQIKCGYTEILAKDLRDHIKSLQARISNEEIKLDREFQVFTFECFF